MDGVIVVDKPSGWTSHDVVNRMRRIAKTRRVGHLGTLDPLATGVLPLILNRATRLAQFYVKNEKAYQALIRFGQSTDTYDREGERIGEPVIPTLTPEAIEQALNSYRGEIQQIPPPVSAKKIKGVPAYKLARQQKPVDLAPVTVTIHELELQEATPDSAKIRLRCSGGTYVRSLAHDLGRQLGCGAHLEELRRTRSGQFSIEQARTLEQLETLSKEDRLAEAVVPAAELLPEFPGEVVDLATTNHIRQGRDFRVSPFRIQRGARYVKAISPQGELVAIGEIKMPNLYHPVLVL